MGCCCGDEEAPGWGTAEWPWRPRARCPGPSPGAATAGARGLSTGVSPHFSTNWCREMVLQGANVAAPADPVRTRPPRTATSTAQAPHFLPPRPRFEPPLLPLPRWPFAGVSPRFQPLRQHGYALPSPFIPHPPESLSRVPVAATYVPSPSSRKPPFLLALASMLPYVRRGSAHAHCFFHARDTLQPAPARFAHETALVVLPMFPFCFAFLPTIFLLFDHSWDPGIGTSGDASRKRMVPAMLARGRQGT